MGEKWKRLDIVLMFNKNCNYYTMDNHRGILWKEK